MNLNNMNLLTLSMLLPLLGTAALAFVPKTNALLTKQIALATTVLVAFVGIAMTLSFDFGATGFQFVESREWIPAFGIKYALGVDGIALVLILMTALLAGLGLLPAALSQDIGSETNRPFACVIVGGITTGTIFMLLILPAALKLFGHFTNASDEAAALSDETTGASTHA